MTADRRLRIGGWAALLVAIVSPFQVVAIWLDVASSTLTATPDPWSRQPYLALDMVRTIAVLIAVVGLDGLFRSLEAPSARTVLLVGAVGAALALGADAMLLAGFDADVHRLITLPADLLIAAWFIGSSLILLRSGRQLARVGWTAMLGGAGLVLVALSVAVDFGGTPGVTGTALIDWFLVVSLFVVIYLVRIWSYVVRGKLPGPGIL